MRSFVRGRDVTTDPAKDMQRHACRCQPGVCTSCPWLRVPDIKLGISSLYALCALTDVP